MLVEFSNPGSVFPALPISGAVVLSRYCIGGNCIVIYKKLIII